MTPARYLIFRTFPSGPSSGTLDAMPRRRRPHIASLDQVRIERTKDGAFIEYADDGVMMVHLAIGVDVVVASAERANEAGWSPFRMEVRRARDS